MVRYIEVFKTNVLPLIRKHFPHRKYNRNYTTTSIVIGVKTIPQRDV